MPLPIAAIAGLLNVAGAAAPLIGQILGGKAEKAGEMVGDIAKVISGKDDVESAVEAIRTDPNLALQFETAVLEQEGSIKRLLIEDARHQRETEAKDRSDARTRDIEIRKLNQGQNTRPNLMIISASLLLGYIIYEVGSSVGPNGVELSKEVIALYSTIAGWILKMLSDAFAFEFGSSAGSKAKTLAMGQTLERMQELMATLNTKVRGGQ